METARWADPEEGEEKMIVRGGNSQWRLGLLAALLAVFSVTGLVLAVNPNERVVRPQPNALDADDIEKPDSKVWVLDFKFKDPRLIKVNIPGKGQTICWYLWYQVINNTSQPHTFIPTFDLVTQDRHTIHHDKILPKVQDAIRLIEDPADYYKIKNSVTIYAEPIPPSQKNAVPRAVTGVAIWDDVDPDSNRYSIFVSGLSNGWAVTDPIPPDTKPVVRRKTLQLNFKRLGDRYLMTSEEIHFVPPYEWRYLGSQLTVPGLPGGEKGREGKGGL